MTRIFTILVVLLLTSLRAEDVAEIRISPEHPESIQLALQAALKNKQSKLVIPAGTYTLPATQTGRHFKIEKVENFELDARGVTFLLPDSRKGTFEFYACKNVTLKGLAIQHITPPFAQGKVVAIAADGKSLDLKLATGYPQNFDDPQFFIPNPTGYFLDANTRQWKTGTGDFGAKSVEKLEPGLFRLNTGGWKLNSSVAVGDLMAFRGKGNSDIYVGNCSGMRIEGVTIQHGSGFVIHEDGGEGGNFYQYKVTYGPKPEGATEAPLIACNADAFHSSLVRKGPTLDGCEFEGMCDDGVPIHGAYNLVVEGSGDKMIVTEGHFKVGDNLRLLSTNGGWGGDAVVTAIKPLPDFKCAQTSRYKPYAELNKRRFMELTLDKHLSAEFDCLVSDLNCIGSGFVVRNCTIKNHRARGMLIKACDGLIENNTVDGSTIAGIVLCPEFWWNEACYSSNVIIRNNTIRHCGYQAVHPGTGQSGSVSVTSEAKPGALPGHRHITIENNTFIENDGTNLLIQFADDVSVKGNVFKQPMRNETNRGSSHVKERDALMYVSDSKNIKFENNTVENAGPLFKRMLVTGSGTSEISGIPTESKKE